ncbi:MAG: uroporphyrinogen decarboxylase family protein [Peptococcaceae bacterium]|nr:uroporphyrinogen decarboxylase family protein [Peptococcaceae bacterium]
MLKPKEIFKKAIKLEPTPRIPVTLLSGGVWVYNRHGMSLQDSFDLPPEQSAEITMQANEEVRSDLVWAAAGCNNLVLRAVGVKVNFHRPGVASDVAEPFLEKASDVDKINLDDIQNDPGINAMLENTKILKKNIGDDVMIGISQWGPLTLAGLMMGTEQFMKLLIKDKPAVHYMMEVTAQMVYRYWDLFLDAGAEYISQAEPSASGDMISKRQFSEFAIPGLTKTNQLIGDKPFAKMIHICGETTKFLELIPDTKADAISLDYKVHLAAARETLDGKIAFLGHMDPVGIMAMATPEQVREDCTRCIRDAQGEKGGYLMMPGCDIPPSVPIENIQAMVDVAYHYLD